MSSVFLLFFITIAAVPPTHGFLNLIQGVKDFMNALDTEGSGKFNRNDRCSISWSFQGNLIGFEWRYLSICKDSCTNEAATAFSVSKPGSVEKCLTELHQKLRMRDEWHNEL